MVGVSNVSQNAAWASPQAADPPLAAGAVVEVVVEGGAVVEVVEEAGTEEADDPTVVDDVVVVAAAQWTTPLVLLVRDQDIEEPLQFTGSDCPPLRVILLDVAEATEIVRSDVTAATTATMGANLRIGRIISEWVSSDSGAAVHARGRE